MRQQSIEIEGVAHDAPIPMACRIGPILATSGVSGKDPATGALPSDPTRQAFHCFDNLKRTLAKAGMDLGDVVKIGVTVTDEALRKEVNKVWLECYPDPHKRPARHTTTGALRGGQLMQIDALAVAKDA